MKKRIIRIGVGVLVALLVLVIAAFIYLDRITQRAIEVGATYATGVETTLGSANLAPFYGELLLQDMVIANPPGFKSDHFLSLGRGEVAVTLPTLMQEQVVIPRLHLDGLSLNLEKHDGQANYQVILEHLKQLRGQPQEQQADSPGKRYVIEEVVVTDVVVSAAVLPSIGEPKALVVRIPQIRLTQVGSDSSGGVVMSQLSGVLMQAVLESVITQAGQALPAAITDGLRSGMEGLGQLGGFVVQSAGDQVAQVLAQVSGDQAVGQLLEDVSGKTGKALEQSVQALNQGLGQAVQETTQHIGEGARKLQEGAGKTLEGLGGLFQKKDESPKDESE